MTRPIQEGDLLWQPSEQMKQQSNMVQFMRWLEQTKGVTLRDYMALWEWSITDLAAFWESIWQFFQVQASMPPATVLAERTMPGARWFPGAELNYAQHIFRNATSQRPALLFRSEREPLREVSWEELQQKVGALARSLRSLGIERGDRVASYLPNIPEAVIAFLACASIGAIWSSCSPDFGGRSMLDRFKQIEPRVLIAVDGYQYNGKVFDKRSVVAELQQSLPGLKKTILVPYLFKDEETIAGPDTLMWNDVVAGHADLTFEQVPFDHPLWILYSSGTTGLPKAIVQGHGGILLEHYKTSVLASDLKPGDRFFWYTSTGWMMWNLLVSSLLTGAAAILYDGCPIYPSLDALWELAEQTGMTFFGTSAGYLLSCLKAGLKPGATYHLNKLRTLGSSGSPLPPEGYQWVYECVKQDIWLTSSSGGTDICSGLVGGCLILPVRAGELQGRALGARVEAFDEQGRSLIGEVGELVITEPMPSMPLYFWNDPDGKRYHESYFNVYPEVWKHGDWIKILPTGSAIISGRSDSTINRMGVRMGSSEIYRVVEDLPELLDSLVVGMELPGGRYTMLLFIVLRDQGILDDILKAKIRRSIRDNVSPHHVPDDILVIPEVPRTLNGKKLEVPIKKLLQGLPPDKAFNSDAMSNPGAMEFFIEYAQRFHTFDETP